MNISISRFLAWRYIKGTAGTQKINSVALISFLSIFIGSCCLSLAVFIMSGFETILAKKMQGAYPQLMISAPSGQALNYKKLVKTLEKDFPQTIRAYAPTHTKQAIFQCKGAPLDTVVQIKIIDPIKEHYVSSLEDCCKPLLAEALKKNKVIIGKTLAEEHGLHEGSIITLISSQNDTFNSDTELEKHVVIVGGIMDTGISHYDHYTVIMSYQTMQHLFEEKIVTQIGIHTIKKTNISQLQKNIKNNYSLEVDSWQTLYPALVSITQMERSIALMLFFLVMLIASANIIALLFMLIVQKQRDIAILKTMGLDSTSIMFLFICIGVGISMCAGLLGVALACLLGFCINHYQLIPLPDAYFCSYLPVDIDPLILLIILATIFIVSFVASSFCARSSRFIQISAILRFEA